jgi:signal transduction histidine kinase
VALPVLQGSALRYVLGARMGDAVWQRLVANANVPQGARAALFDAQGLLIGDSQAQAIPGTPLAGDAARDMSLATSGVHRSTDVNGGAVYAAWDTVARSGWRVRVTLPAPPIDAAHRQAIVAALSTSGGSLLVGLLLGALVARRIGRPLRALANKGPDGLPGRLPVREIALLRDALALAHQQDLAARQSLQATAEELLASQKLIDLTQEAGHVGFFHYEFKGDDMSWTPGQCRLFDVDELPQATLADWFSRVAAGDRDRVELEFWTACALRRETVTIEYCFTRSDGSSRWLSSRLMLQYDPDGSAARFIGVTVDMTEQREADRARAETTQRALAAREEAEAASRAKDEFLMMLSHELRNPLGAISAAVDVLDSNDVSSENALEARAIIGRQTRNLAHMMNDLLDVGRVMAGKVMLAREPVNLAAIVQRVDETLALTGESTHHPLRLDLRDAWVEGDAVRIEQIVTNLFVNAIKYTPAGREITVMVRTLEDRSVLQVRDAGMGIPETLLPHIFDLFVQGHRPLDRRTGGLGIGLTLVRSLVELHGGAITAESSGEGSCFTVRMPSIPAPDQKPDQALPPSRRRNVLVVDDNDDVLTALRAKLELDGHTVTTAADGVEGLSRLLKLRPEVSIVDIGLPGITGYELARHARAAGYAGRMIALSGYGAERDAHEALVAGFDAYLVKPVDRNRLRASLSAD